MIGWLVLPLLLAAGSPSDDVFLRFLRHFQSIRTMEARFVQSVENNFGTETATGILWLRKPDRMRWDYLDPEKKVFLLEKGRFSFYLPAENQWIVQKLDQADLESSALVFLLGGRKSVTEFYQIMPLESIGGRHRYQLTAIAREAQFPRVMLTLSGDPPFIQEMELHEETGAVHTYRLEQVKINEALPDKIFRFSPPAGVEIIRED